MFGMKIFVCKGMGIGFGMAGMGMLMFGGAMLLVVFGIFGVAGGFVLIGIVLGIFVFEKLC